MLEIASEEQLTEDFLKYYCTKDKDIQNFLQVKALYYENRGWCSTYILANEEKLAYENTLFVEGYFTLSNKVIQLSDSISGNRRKKFFGGIKKSDHFMHAILIGQLGKYIYEEEEQQIYGETSAEEMLDQAFQIIYEVKERIACNCVLVECKDEPKVRSIYESYGFTELQQEKELIQYFKII